MKRYDMVRRIAVMLLCFLCLNGVGLATENDLQIQVLSDKVEYDWDGTAELTLCVKNTSDKAIRNVSITHRLPEGLEYTEDSRNGLFSIDEIAPQETMRFALRVRKKQPGVVVTLKSDQETYSDIDVARITISIRNMTDDAISNVRVDHILPSGLEYADPSQIGMFSKRVVGAGETIEADFLIRKKAPDLQVTLKSDQASYWRGDIAKLTVTVKNNTDKTFADVNIEHLLPNGLKYVKGKEEHTFSHARIGAYETVQHDVYVERLEDPPQTGDQSDEKLFVFALMLVLCGLLSIGLMKAKNKSAMGYYGGEENDNE